jgi:hypothetical protein
MKEFPLLTVLGAGAFGAIIGWYVYYINRYRKSDVQLGDITTLVGVLGGGTATASDCSWVSSAISSVLSTLSIGRPILMRTGFWTGDARGRSSPTTFPATSRR